MSVSWLKPSLVRGQIRWSHRCEEQVNTPQTVEWRQRVGIGMGCRLSARVDYHGTRLCVQHAKIRALAELAGPQPVLEEIGVGRDLP